LSNYEKPFFILTGILHGFFKKLGTFRKSTGTAFLFLICESVVFTVAAKTSAPIFDVVSTNLTQQTQYLRA